MQQRLVNRAVLILVLTVITVAFVMVISPFLMEMFLAALFAALFSPLYQKFLSLTRRREALASILTLVTVLMFVIVPISVLSATLVSQALNIAETAKPWMQEQLATPGLITAKLQALPWYDQLLPYRDTAVARLGELSASVSRWAVEQLQSATLGTLNALLSIFIMLYTMFFFLINGDRLLYHVLYYLPLNDEDETILLNRFVSVSKATLKGTAVIGFLQGAFAGTAMWMAGVPSALFWAVTMMVLSIVPGVGTALVWAPAVVYLLIIGKFGAAISLGVFCVVVVGTIDNLLRPKLVGNDTQLHELMIFFSTLGGLLLFGFMGFVIGPIIAALFVTIWELYGYEFRDWLPYTAFKPKSGPVVLPHERLAAAAAAGPRAQAKSAKDDASESSEAESEKTPDTPPSK